MIRICALCAFLWLLLFPVLAAGESKTSASAAEAALNEADKLRSEQREASSLKAVEKYREAATLFRRSGDLRRAAAPLRNAGEILQLLGNTPEALSVYKEALVLSKKTRDPVEEAHILNDLAYLHFIAGNTKDAQLNSLAALHIGKTLHNREIEAEALSNLGEALYAAGQIVKAREQQQRSLELWRELSNSRGQAIASIALGYYHRSLGDPEKAQRSYDEGLSLARHANDLGVETLALVALCNFKRKSGNNQEALESYAAAKVIADRIGDQTLQATILGGMGSIYLQMGDARQALQYIAEAAKLMERNGKRWGTAEAKLQLGKIHRSLGDREQALQYLTEALDLFKSLGMPRLQSATLREVGLVYDALGDTSKALESQQKALRLMRSGNDRREEAYILNYIGRIYEELKQSDRALKYYRRALPLSLRSEDPNGELLAYYNLAHVERDRGNLPEAKRQVEAALEIVESQRSNVLSQDLRTSYFATARSTYDLYIDILMQLHKQSPNSGLDAQAFAVSEKARARSFLESLREARANMLLTPEPSSLKEAQQRVLDDETVLLEYALGDDRSYVWLVTRSVVFSYELPRRAEIEASARRLYDLITSYQLVYGESIAARSERQAKANAAIPAETAVLSKLILGPLSRQLEKKRLLVIADGSLQYIPFQILTDPDSGESLIARHEIVNAPSVSTLAVLQAEAAKRKRGVNSVAVLADPVFEADDPRVKRKPEGAHDRFTGSSEVRQAMRDVGLSPDGLQIPRLIASGAEADEIVAVAPWRTGLKAVGFAANRERVFGPELATYRIVHFATHGIIDSERPELSGIVLSLFDSEGHAQNGFLRLHDIYNLRLPADLVVLSACSTGLGKDVRGEGLIGLTRGFMYAGASGVIASLWKVDDDATAELMKHFYAAMFKKGLPPAAALRDAQLALSQQTRWQSPYYWAGFVIQGQYTENEKFVEPFPSKTQLALLTTLGVCALGVFLWRNLLRHY
jgi:CHAT domain-containing protein